MAYLGAWVFNVLVVVIPRLRTEEQVLTELPNPIQGITGTGASLRYELALRAAEANPGGAVQPFPDPLPSLTEERIREVCAAVDISATWPRFLTSAGRPQQAWAEYLASEGIRIQGFIQRVQPAYPLLDSELVAAIQAVANSSYLLQVPRLPRIPMNNDNLEFLAPDIFEVRNRCDRLTVYFDERIRPLTEHHRT